MHAPPNSNSFYPPPGSHFAVGPKPSLSVRLISGRSLIAADLNGKSDPYVRVIQSRNQYTSKVIEKTLNPTWNETFTLAVANPATEMLIVEVYDKDKYGKDDLLGYVAIDLALLPRGMEVVTWEKLSSVPHGEINIGLTATDFGLENVHPMYVNQYAQWRQTIPTVGKNAKFKHDNKHKGKKDKKHGGAKHPKAAGPYNGKSVPHGYSISNGYVKKLPTEGEKALHQASKVTTKALKGAFNAIF
jgi:hypothetical protein